MQLGMGEVPENQQLLSQHQEQLYLICCLLYVLPPFISCVKMILPVRFQNPVFLTVIAHDIALLVYDVHQFACQYSMAP